MHLEQVHLVGREQSCILYAHFVQSSTFYCISSSYIRIWKCTRKENLLVQAPMFQDLWSSIRHPWMYVMEGGNKVFDRSRCDSYQQYEANPGTISLDSDLDELFSTHLVTK